MSYVLPTFLYFFRYGKELKKARKVGYIKSLIIGILMALLFFVLFACYALAFGCVAILIYSPLKY